MPKTLREIDWPAQREGRKRRIRVIECPTCKAEVFCINYLGSRCTCGAVYSTQGWLMPAKEKA